MEKITIDSKFADQEGEVMVVELGGHVDQSNSFQLQKMFESIIQSGCYKVIVDFKNLYYMSSAGWGVFVGEIKRFRENGGDIKLAAMNPEIYDVYQMLEFYHILDDYPRVEDAASSFGKDREELNLALDSQDDEAADSIESDTKIEEIEIENDDKKRLNDKPEEKKADIISFVPDASKVSSFSESSFNEFIPPSLQQDVKLSELPLAEKVKRVVAQNPILGIWQIKKVLSHDHFGNTRIGILRLWKMLKELDLESREKRYRFYRSC